MLFVLAQFFGLIATVFELVFVMSAINYLIVR